MKLQTLLCNHHLILTEGAIIERIRREFDFCLDPHLANAAMIYDPKGKEILEQIYRQYLDIGQKYRIPMLILTPTWRANQENIEKAGMQDRDVNRDCFNFLDHLRSEYGTYAQQILIGGLVGCKGDAYKPNEALPQESAFAFHGFQIQALARAGVDFLIASTLPAFSEALGIGQAIAETHLDYILSFVVRSTGTLLDATTLADAISKLDHKLNPHPLCYMANCTHPTVLATALLNKTNSSDFAQLRLMGLQANTSAKSPEDLDGSVALETQEPNDLAQEMARLHANFNIKICGGCCGTDHRHILAMAEKLSFSNF